ncbi:hypothetical protein BDF20DRAFT_457428 [Mycotypha africana]|uniref:uncharacterized protein n=1 Tax=Mycotypha africana TaxID=64632 RepID=UPI0023010F01|nr:uncharacterized protein BDF20DRAFT_457428 [Mycotypha africana]KAI8982212.1 hypothetical protein BDF20DRAFT_457428 [Mycotypha africana]
MISGRLLDLLDQIARKVRLSNAPFGGIQVVFCGDFYQLPPVADHTKPNDDFAFKARCWKDLNMKVMLLKSFFRQKDFKY